MLKDDEAIKRSKRRNVIRKVAATGAIGSAGLANFASLGAGSEEQVADSGEDETTVGPDMNLPGGGGSGASDEIYHDVTEEANSRSDNSYDYTTLSEPSSNQTDFTVNETVLGDDYTVTGASAKVTYKTCNGVTRQMVVAEVSITVEGSGGVASYSQWVGIAEDGCFYIGDSHGCTQLSTCNAQEVADSPENHVDTLYAIAEQVYDRAKENSDTIVSIATALFWAIIAGLAFFLAALAAAFGSATA